MANTDNNCESSNKQEEEQQKLQQQTSIQNYTEYEQELKSRYYKSNPLRKYAPTRGQTILPGRSADTLKKPLPEIYNELRVSKDLEQDRSMHRQKMRSALNLNLKSLEQQKNPIDLLENSKKVYSEYCKYNLTKPIDLTNVESTLKINLKLPNNNTKPKEDSNDIENSSLYMASPKPNHLSKSSDLLIDAQTVEIKKLDDISQEIKNRKTLLAKMDYNEESTRNVKYSYRMTKSSSSVTNNMPPQHKGSIYNYRQAVKALNSMQRIGSAPTYTTSEHSGNDDSESESGNNKLNSMSMVEQQQNAEMQEVDTLQQQQQEYERLKRVIYSASMSPEEKYKLRIKQAREKILYEQIEKQNLNKMTILQPFEDTKILININQVPSRFLNSLLNKHHIAPRYYIPPIRAFGYFKKVVTEPQVSQSSKPVKPKKLNAMPVVEPKPENHNFSLDTLKTLNEAYLQKEASFVSNHTNKQSIGKLSSANINANNTINENATSTNNNNNNNSNSVNNFELKVEMVKKDVTVK